METIAKLIKELISLLTQYLAEKPPVPPVPIEKDVKPAEFNRNKEILIKLASQMGIKEGMGAANNPQVQEYLAYGGSTSNKAKYQDSVPWCAGFVGWVLEKCGMGSTNSLMARSYEKWGVDVSQDPLPGDVVTFYRGDKSKGFGHVTFFLKRVGELNYCAGGNQSDMVNIASYSKNKMTSIRRSSKQQVLSETERDELHSIASAIMAGNKIDSSGKVV
jgi:uncharacterized protein (TIGR02594 family)